MSRSETSAEAVVAGASQRRAEREGVILGTVMCWEWHQMSALAERSGWGEVKPSLTQTVMKTDARALNQRPQG
jgi:hypothetical protein